MYKKRNKKIIISQNINICRGVKGSIFKVLRALKKINKI